MESEFSGNISPRVAWLGPFLGIIVDNPDQIQKVLNSKYCIDKPLLYSHMGPPKGLGDKLLYVT